VVAVQVDHPGVKDLPPVARLAQGPRRREGAVAGPPPELRAHVGLTGVIGGQRDQIQGPIVVDVEHRDLVDLSGPIHTPQQLGALGGGAEAPDEVDLIGGDDQIEQAVAVEVGRAKGVHGHGKLNRGLDRAGCQAALHEAAQIHRMHHRRARRAGDQGHRRVVIARPLRHHRGRGVPPGRGDRGRAGLLVADEPAGRGRWSAGVTGLQRPKAAGDGQGRATAQEGEPEDPVPSRCAHRVSPSRPP